MDFILTETGFTFYYVTTIVLGGILGLLLVDFFITPTLKRRVEFLNEKINDVVLRQSRDGFEVDKLLRNQGHRTEEIIELIEGVESSLSSLKKEVKGLQAPRQ